MFIKRKNIQMNAIKIGIWQKPLPIGKVFQFMTMFLFTKINLHTETVPLDSIQFYDLHYFSLFSIDNILKKLDQLNQFGCIVAGIARKLHEHSLYVIEAIKKAFLLWNIVGQLWVTMSYLANLIV